MLREPDMETLSLTFDFVILMGLVGYSYLCGCVCVCAFAAACHLCLKNSHSKLVLCCFVRFGLQKSYTRYSLFGFWDYG